MRGGGVEHLWRLKTRLTGEERRRAVYCRRRGDPTCVEEYIGPGLDKVGTSRHVLGAGKILRGFPWIPDSMKGRPTRSRRARTT